MRVGILNEAKPWTSKLPVSKPQLEPRATVGLLTISFLVRIFGVLTTQKPWKIIE